VHQRRSGHGDETRNLFPMPGIDPRVLVCPRSLCKVNKHWGSGGIAPPFLTWALDGREWSVSRPCHFTPGTHWIGGWGAPEQVWTL
jgi:hypothetical protein